MSVVKNILIGTAIATTVAGAAIFALAPIYTGRMIEQDFRNNMARTSTSAPNGLHVSVESYERGWRSSTAVTHWQFPDSKVEFRLQHHIEHGPSPQYAVARIETTPVIPSEVQARVQRFFKGSPVTATTLIEQNGAATTTIVSPAFNPTPTEDPNVQLGWGGLNAVLTQRGDLFQLSGDVPTLTINNANKHEQMTVTALHIEGDTKITGNGMPLVGSGAIALGAMEVVTAETGTFKMGITRLASRQDERGDLLDMQFMLSNDGMSSSGGTKPPFKVSKCELEYRLRNLDKAAYQKYQEQMSQLFSRHGDKQTLAATALPQTMAAANELLHAVAARSPILEIPKLHIAFDQGAIDGTLTATFNGNGLATWPPAMDEAMKRATVNATLRAPEALMRMVAESKARESAKQMLAAQSMEDNEANIRAVSANIVDQQMQMLAQSPYVKREGNDFATTLIVQNGQIKINGQPLGNLAAMGMGGDAPPGPEGLPPAATPPIALPSENN